LTGASGALGSAFIERYAADLQIIAVHHERELNCATQYQTIIDPLQPARVVSSRTYAIRADLSSEDSIAEMCSEALEAFGGIDLLINAAVHRRYAHLLSDSALSDAERALAVNLLAPIRIAVQLANEYWDSRVDENLRRNRNIVNLSSTAGLYVCADLGQAMYGSAKAALIHATYHLASEFWNIGIRVNAIAPNTFPSIVSTESVLDQIMAFHGSEETGQLAVLDRA